MLTKEGKDAFYKMLFRGDNTIVAAGGNFYIGVCNQVPSEDDTLADITTEPNSNGGYARVAVSRDATGWPTIDELNGDKRIISAVKTLLASGADFSANFTRLFLTDAASGSTGTLFAYSGAAPSEIDIDDGGSHSFRFEFFL